MKKPMAGLTLALTLSFAATVGTAAPASVDNVAWNNNVTYTEAQAVLIAANTPLLAARHSDTPKGRHHGLPQPVLRPSAADRTVARWL
ncbi:hypothetical protein [Mycobacterium sp. GA-1199]|uniref:hypothetical protein n=1 Tax=Mycobacterium sp. GA-1199 TaxID=1772287 RepID=UPI0018D209F0|nr:hypothetical protein [Mycobacterium sp. GA-1199]